MAKTLHQKLTGKNLLIAHDALDSRQDGLSLSAMRLEMKIMEEALKEMLSPRQAAVEKILQLSKTL